MVLLPRLRRLPLPRRLPPELALLVKTLINKKIHLILKLIYLDERRSLRESDSLKWL